MARPIKQGLDYFPLDVGFLRDIKVRRIIKSCGASAISVLIWLLCSCYRDEGYYIEWTEDMPFIVADEIGVTEGCVIEVVKRAVQVGFFDDGMKKKYGILTSGGIQKRFLEITSRRKSVFLRREFALNSVNVDNNPVNVCNNSVNVCNNPQSKVKESKVKERKKRERTTTTKFKKPTLEEVQAYCQEKGYTFNADAFVDYYESNGWRVGRNPMRSWKAACSTWQRKEKEWQPEEKKKLILPDYYGMQ